MKNGACAVQQVLEIVEGFAVQRVCANCLPCLLATEKAVAVLEQLRDGKAAEGDAQLLQKICRHARNVVRCKKGRDVFSMVGSLLGERKEEFLTHAQARQCPAGTCTALISYRIEPDKCTYCDRCRQVCPTKAIVGEPVAPYRVARYPYEIINVKCTRCGQCVAACEAGAITAHLGKRRYPGGERSSPNN